MANQFYVAPPDTSGFLQQLIGGYDRSRKLAQEQELRAAYQDVGNQIQQGGSVNQNSLGRLIGMGPSAAPLITAVSQLGKAETTNDLKNLAAENASRAAKGQPPLSIMEYETALKKAGATNVSVNTGEKAYDKVLNEGAAKRFMELQTAGGNAAKSIPTLDVMERLVENPGFYSGPLAESLVLPLKRGAAALGADPSGVASMENFRALSNKSVLDSMGGSLGTGFSNADRDFVVGQVANLGNTPEGNKQLISIHRKVEQRKQEVAKLARDYAGRNGGRIDSGFDQVLADYAEKNPLFKQAPKGTGGQQRLRFNPASGLLE